MTESSSVPTPHVVIYQNADFVAALLQDFLNEGLLVSGEAESTQKENFENSRNKSGGAKVAVQATLPVVGGIEGSFDHTRERASVDGTETAGTARRQYSYGQAYYLQLLKRCLKDHVKEIAEKADADDLAGGEFVVFTGRFRANEINAILDIATPELVAAATRFFVRHSARPSVDNNNYDIDQLKYSWEAAEQKATTYADLAHEATRAIRVDFRSEETREFYCQLGGLTAVTVCDAAHFVTDDQDRLLDGQFTVLGKVTTPVDSDVPVFSRNKILRRLNPDFVASIFGDLARSVGSATPQQQLRNILNAGGEESEEAPLSPVDLTFSAKIEGPSFTVLPIAIYV